MSQLGTETAIDVFVKAKALEAQQKDIVHLEVGEPDFSTPENIVAAGMEALRRGHTRYTASAGTPELRAAIARHVSETRNVDVSPEHVVVTPGAKPILFFTLLALIESGDEVIYPDPGFPIYESMIKFCGGRPVPLRLREEHQFRFDPDEFRSLITARTRLIIINSPQNPTGGVLDAPDLEVIADVATKRDIPVLSDEIYWRLLYEGEYRSIVSLSGMRERTILMDGFSKAYAMTGWRLGYGVIPPSLAPHINRLIINSNSCTAAMIQSAGIEALDGPQTALPPMLAAFRERRDALVRGLNALPGFRCQLPRGAFYAFPNIQATGWSSAKLADYLLNEAGVACLSGTAFGDGGEGYLRFSYATSLENIHKALGRIRSAIEKIRS